MAEAFRSSIPIPTFNGDNYDFWSIKMKTYFCAQNLWDVVNDGYTNPDDISTLTSAQKKELKENHQKDSLALLSLQMSLTNTYFPRIMGVKTAKEVWDKLKEEFYGSNKVRTCRLQTLRRNFENLKMKESETAKDYYSRIDEIVNQLKSYGDDVPEKKVVGKILITCTEKYDPIIAAIEESKDINELTAAELMGSLEAHEKRLERRYEMEIENAFQSKLNMRFQKSKEVFVKEKVIKRKIVGLKETEGNLFYASKKNVSEKKLDTWYLDSGCSNHMTKDEIIFYSLDKINTKIKIGNGNFIEATGKGTIVVDTKKGKRYINEVLLVPTIDQNLLSVGQMMEK
ncbi:uncharacterized protein LOC111366977 [Olea europaea var. sylvestris]|uniref:uncharacterized protein LOC111366977 n=1 Tax=Olea europaea var. sylvestris TaxID=158386 RepID=UPI000C1D5D38|nr:uncharacterized protein LOC111366977 [Olea europaea var. sylvestris]